MLNADDQPVDDHIQMKIDRKHGAKSRGQLPREPWQAKDRRYPREQDLLDQRKRKAQHDMESAITPPGSSRDGKAASQPPDEGGEKSPGLRGRQPDHEIAVPLDSSALIQNTARILANEEKREQSPAAQISQPAD